ncbi:unnamed protein product, partial [Ixodes hexagonus]
LLDTPGCKIPNYDPFAIGIVAYAENLTRNHKVCRRRDPPVVFQDTSIPILDEVRLRKLYGISTSNVSCYYAKITRNESAMPPDDSFSVGPEFPITFGMRLDLEFIKIRCFLKQTEFYHGFHLIPQLKRTRMVTAGDQMNVLILGMDSVSRLNMIRRMPRSRKFVLESMEAFELLAYNKVGENTFPNLMPLLSGHSGEEVTSMTRNRTFDDIPFLWNHFKRKGYRTVFMEEMPRWSLFIHPSRQGFRRKPTDYYPFPIVKAIGEFDQKQSGCMGTRLISEIYLDYIAELIILMRSRRFLVFLWLADWSHEDMNTAGVMDDPLKHFLKRLHAMAVFSHTALFFLSDHGMRHGQFRNTPLGAHEVNLPFFLLSLPDWFKAKFPSVVESLRVNRHRLTTPYDIHATIKSLASLPEFDPRGTGRGLNLFRQIPPWRTCGEALIPTQFCSCERAEERLEDNSTAHPYALFGLAFINAEAQRHFPGKCVTWSLDVVTDAAIMRGSVTRIRWFRVTLTTVPKAHFQVFGTVQLNGRNKGSRVEFVERLDWYSNWTRCLPPSTSQKLCMCKEGV